MKNLVIVESPAKAKTIEKYLGKDFTVLSSVGHIRSIPAKTKNKLPPIDVKNGFKTVYEVDKDKTKVITELKKAIKQAEQVWLATDDDREGEAIAWHLTEVLKLDPKNTKRITFNEITKEAITKAVKEYRTIDMDLVQAQQARQILDHLVGFELSPVIWRKVPGGKSGGRVQSPAVRLVVEKEQEIVNFTSKFGFKLTAIFTDDGQDLKAELDNRVKTESEAQTILNNLISDDFKVFDIKSSDLTRSPKPPFTTSTLQQEANIKLGFSSKQTMTIAQKLYQAGHTTYMRTDSVRLSQQAIANAKATISSNWGDNYCHSRNFATKSQSAQEAHEAIRPTNFKKETAGTTAQEHKLYNLIRMRALASQMSNAKIKKTVIKIKSQNHKYLFVTQGEIVVFPGFLKAYETLKPDQALPDLKLNENLNLVSAEARQVFKRPPSRYTEGNLVKKLEELGIGRPSTYATILDTIVKRGYVEKGITEGVDREIILLTLDNNIVSKKKITEKTGSDKGKLIPQPIGQLLTTFLTEHFTNIVDYDFTAKVENEFDQIAKGQLERNLMLDEFYQGFHQLIVASDDIKRSEVSKPRQLGVDPTTKLPVYARLGRFGPMLQLGDSSTDKEAPKPRFATMPKNTTIESVAMEQALPMFALPRLVGVTANTQYTKAGIDILANIGRFGPYIKLGSTFISIKDHDPLTIDLATALDFIENKFKADAQKIIADFGKLKILNGRFGAYITDGEKNVKIPKDIDPKELNQVDTEKLFKTSATKNKSKPTKTKTKTKAKAKTKVKKKVTKKKITKTK